MSDESQSKGLFRLRSVKYLNLLFNRSAIVVIQLSFLMTNESPLIFISEFVIIWMVQNLIYSLVFLFFLLVESFSLVIVALSRRIVCKSLKAVGNYK